MSILKPTSCPWGKIQQTKRLAEGVYWVSTASHGGILVHDSISLSAELLAQKIPRHTTRSASWFFFEEDSDVYLIFLEYRLEGRDDLCPGVSTEKIIYSLSWSYPDYLISKGIDPSPEPYSKYLERKRDWERIQNKDPNLIVARLATKVDGILKIWTADGKSYLAEKLSESLELEDYKILKDLTGIASLDGIREYITQLPKDALAMMGEILNISPEQLRKDGLERAYIVIRMTDDFEHMIEYFRLYEGGPDEVASIHLESYPNLLETLKQFYSRK